MTPTSTLDMHIDPSTPAYPQHFQHPRVSTPPTGASKSHDVLNMIFEKQTHFTDGEFLEVCNLCQELNDGEKKQLQFTEALEKDSFLDDDAGKVTENLRNIYLFNRHCHQIEKCGHELKSFLIHCKTNVNELKTSTIVTYQGETKPIREFLRMYKTQRDYHLDQCQQYYDKTDPSIMKHTCSTFSNVVMINSKNR